MFVLLMAAFLTLPGQTPVGAPVTFDSANKSYEEGRYAEAAAAYDQLLKTGQASAPVYYNRGNAWFKLGQLGRAIASYRVAESLSPRDTDLRANLQLARTRARGGVPYQAERWRVWLGIISLNEWTCLTAGAVWILFVLLAVGQWRPERAIPLRKYTFTAGMAALFPGICLMIQLTSGYFSETAIVTTGEAEVRNGPLEESPGLYKVRDGIELKVIDHLGGWLQVMDSAQRVGWLRADQVLIFSRATEKAATASSAP